MKARWLALVASLGLLPLQGIAGEILIVEPASGSRNQRALDATLDKARQRQTGKSADATPGTVIITTDDQPSARRGAERAREAMEDAESYLSPGTGVISSETMAEDGTKIILRKEPPSGARRARLKARSYLEGDDERQDPRRCVVVNQVGTIGEGEGAKQSTNVFEKGNSAVTVCK